MAGGLPLPPLYCISYLRFFTLTNLHITRANIVTGIPTITPVPIKLPARTAVIETPSSKPSSVALELMLANSTENPSLVQLSSSEQSPQLH